MSNIDDYLLHNFHLLDAGTYTEESFSEEALAVKPRLPMLLHVRRPSWRPRRIPQCSVIAQVGDIIACLGSLQTIEVLQNDPDILSIEGSRPISNLECRHSLPLTKADIVHLPPFHEKGDKALIAIIDNGIDVLHHAFRDETGKQTRILAVWDQTDPRGPAPILRPSQIKLGTVYTGKQINKYITHPQSLPEGLKMAREWGEHGTHVASIATGRAIPQSGFVGGVAPEAGLIVVIPQLDSSIGYSNGHIAALAFIRQIAQKHNLPVVINLSQGMNGGAHDGTSALETAFDQFTNGGREAGCAVVKSAGNERDKGGHAKLSLHNNQRIILPWQVERADRRFPQPAKEQATIEIWFKACDEMTWRVKNPPGEYTPRVNKTNPTQQGRFAKGQNFYEISYKRYCEDNGDSRLLITLASERPGQNILPGAWALEIECDTIRSAGEAHAWIERSPRRNIHFTDYLSAETTLSVPGTAHTVICVGSISATSPFTVPFTSSYGPTRDKREKPDICAPGENITAAQSNSLIDLIAKSGTSMAAPHATGAIALLFSFWEKKIQGDKTKRLNAAQVQAALRQTTQNFNSYWRYDTGYGVLDIEQLLAAFT